MMRDPFEILGVSPDATDEEISRAYKALARKYHPDLNPDDTQAEQRMKELNLAYDRIQAIRSGKEAYPPSDHAPEKAQRQEDDEKETAPASTEDTQDGEEPDFIRSASRKEKNIYRLVLVGLILLVWLIPLLFSMLTRGCR